MYARFHLCVKSVPIGMHSMYLIVVREFKGVCVCCTDRHGITLVSREGMYVSMFV